MAFATVLKALGRRFSTPAFFPWPSKRSAGIKFRTLAALTDATYEQGLEFTAGSIHLFAIGALSPESQAPMNGRASLVIRKARP